MGWIGVFAQIVCIVVDPADDNESDTFGFIAIDADKVVVLQPPVVLTSKSNSPETVGVPLMVKIPPLKIFPSSL